MWDNENEPRGQAFPDEDFYDQVDRAYQEYKDSLEQQVIPGCGLFAYGTHRQRELFDLPPEPAQRRADLPGQTKLFEE